MCTSPKTAWRGERNSNGKRPLVFTEKHADPNCGEELEVPCRQCIECRLQKSNEWALRLEHENALHDCASFVTLTYSPENIPHGETLVKTDLQKFMKRLRKQIATKYDDLKIRFYACGEYGSQLDRPHYHLIIFGFDFPDKQAWAPSGQETLYRSELLEKCWQHGFSTVGAVERDSIAYVARYSMKKITGDCAKDHYEYTDPYTGEIIDKQPEFALMSRRPGIGAGWYEKYKTDCFPTDFLVRYNKNGKDYKTKPPGYYLDLLEKNNPDLHEAVVENRKMNRKSSEDWARLDTRARIHKIKADRVRKGSKINETENLHSL